MIRRAHDEWHVLNVDGTEVMVHEDQFELFD